VLCSPVLRLPSVFLQWPFERPVHTPDEFLYLCERQADADSIVTVPSGLGEFFGRNSQMIPGEPLLLITARGVP
jgi:hypothetical protein